MTFGPGSFCSSETGVALLRAALSLCVRVLESCLELADGEGALEIAQPAMHASHQWHPRRACAFGQRRFVASTSNVWEIVATDRS